MIDKVDGDKVKEIREELSISQEEMAGSINVNQPTISTWENGEVKMSRFSKAKVLSLAVSEDMEHVLK